MKISGEMDKILREYVQTPLVVGEARHVPELGEYYIALPGAEPKMAGHTFRRQYNWECDQVIYSIYMRNMSHDDDR